MQIVVNNINQKAAEPVANNVNLLQGFWNNLYSQWDGVPLNVWGLSFVYNMLQKYEPVNELEFE